MHIGLERESEREREREKERKREEGREWIHAIIRLKTSFGEVPNLRAEVEHLYFLLNINLCANVSCNSPSCGKNIKQAQ